ncbi:MAG TPA: hypothetical protein VJ787_08375, partial [Thermoleophilia bacterium]|nr:hypothetical protein [Thermoleophilia bacterium]
DAATRQAFFRGLRDVIDLSGQAVSALGRLYRAAQLPTLIVWGAQDSFIPVSHAVAAHKAIPGSRLEIFDGMGHYPPLPALRGPGALRRGAHRLHRLHQACPPVGAVSAATQRVSTNC